MKDQHELESEIQEWLDEIKTVPGRNPQAAARGRAQFLGQAVSAYEFQRHKGWSSIFGKERFAMNMIVSILVIAGLLFGGGATVNAAQDDLPDEPLYALKMWSEDLSLQLQSDPEQRVDRLMELAQVRTQEMIRLADASQAVPDQTRLRLEQHINQALQVCTSMDEATLDQVLLQIRDRLQQQDRDMERLQLHAAQDAVPGLVQARTMLQQRLQLVEGGLLNHEMFRNTVRNGFRFEQEDVVNPPAQNRNGLQNGQPTSVPAGSNTNPGGPNTDQGGVNIGPGEPNMTMTPSPMNGGNGSGGNGSRGGDSGGTGSGGGGSGGSGSGGGSGAGGGGCGCGGNKP